MEEEFYLFIVMREIETDELYQFLIESNEEAVLAFHERKQDENSILIHKELGELVKSHGWNKDSLVIDRYKAFNKKDLKYSM